MPFIWTAAWTHRGFFGPDIFVILQQGAVRDDVLGGGQQSQDWPWLKSQLKAGEVCPLSPSVCHQALAGALLSLAQSRQRSTPSPSSSSLYKVLCDLKMK